MRRSAPYVDGMALPRQIVLTVTRIADSVDGRCFPAGTRVVTSGVPLTTSAVCRTGSVGGEPQAFAEFFANSEAEIVEQLRRGVRYSYRGRRVRRRKGRLFYRRRGAEHFVPFPLGKG
jgi:hypothetical protein